MDDIFLDDDDDDDPLEVDESPRPTRRRPSARRRVDDDGSDDFSDDFDDDFEGHHPDDPPSEAWKVLVALVVAIGVFVCMCAGGVIWVKSMIDSADGDSVANDTSVPSDRPVEGVDDGRPADAAAPNAKVGGAAWYVLSNFRKKRRQFGIGSDYEIDYRLVQGNPAAYRLIIEPGDGKYYETDVPRNRSGTIRVSIQSIMVGMGKTTAYVGERVGSRMGGNDPFLKRSGVITLGGPPTTSKAPANLLRPHERSPNWKPGKPWVVLSNFRKQSGRFGQTNFSVDYEIVQGNVSSCDLIISDGGPVSTRYDVRLNQRGTLSVRGNPGVGIGIGNGVECYLRVRQIVRSPFAKGEPQRYSGTLKLGATVATSSTPP